MTADASSGVVGLGLLLPYRSGLTHNLARTLLPLDLRGYRFTSQGS